MHTWEPSSRKRLTLILASSILVALCLAIVARLCEEDQLLPKLATDLMTLAAILVVISPSFYITYYVQEAFFLRILTISAAVCLAVSAFLEFTGTLPQLSWSPLFADASDLHRGLLWFLTMLGSVLLIASLYFTLVEAASARSETQRKHNDLLNEVQERERAQAALREQDDLYRLAISQAGAIPYRVNWQTMTGKLFHNGAGTLANIVGDGYDFSQYLKMRKEVRYLGPLGDMSPQEVEKQIEKGLLRTCQCEYMMLAHDGSEVWFFDSWTGIPDDQGRVAEAIGLIQDVTHKKREEQAQIRKERYYRALIENALDIITVLRRDASVRFVSPSIESVLGYSPNELVGMDIVDLVAPQDRLRFMEAIGNLDTTPSGFDMGLFQFRHKDGSVRILQSVGRDFSDYPGISGLMLNIRDLTDRVNLETQLQQSQKLEAVGRLAGGIAHDFNNLLTAIMGNVELALMRLDDTDEKTREHLDQANLVSQSAADLIRQLLTFARKQHLEMKAVHLNHIALNLDRMLRRLIDVNISLSTIPAALNDLVRVDTGQIEQVLVNLVVNARDAMPHGGSITVSTQDVPQKGPRNWCSPNDLHKDFVSISVTDTGTGMSPEVIEHIFEPFFTTKSQGKGTGLGLATSYGIVKQAGGYFEVSSEIERGTTFRVFLPVFSGQEELFPDTESRNPILNGNETILLVEDTEQTLFIIQTILRSYGYTVIGRTNGEDAIKVANEYGRALSLLIIDVVMPSMNGMEVAKRVRALTPETRVLFISGYTDKAPIPVSNDNKTAFLPKPFTPSTLVRHVRALLDSNKTLIKV
ncbi:MAG: PAS domain S-box protein [Candidatus Hydrogenedentes bacterium]|nr:PAS domain S-box protein [Candidatus Hydrogenedentota bacterium]